VKFETMTSEVARLHPVAALMVERDVLSRVGYHDGDSRRPFGGEAVVERYGKDGDEEEDK